MADYTDGKLYSREEEQALIERIRNGEQEAREELILRTKPLISIVLRTRFNFDPNTLCYYDPDELVQEGMLAIMMALERFEPERGVRFTTFAQKYVYGAINEYLSNLMFSASVSVPKRALRDLARGKLRESTQNALKVARHTDAGVSFDAYLERHCETGDSVQFEELMMSKLHNESLKLLLLEAVNAVLSPRVRHIVIMYFGLGIPQNAQFSKAQLAREFNCTVTSINTIIKKAVEMIMNSQYRDRLYQSWDVT